MKILIGKKVGMTQIYNDKDVIIPTTIIQSNSCVVIDILNKQRNGYSAVQLGYGMKKNKNSSKAVIGHCNKANYDENCVPQIIKEFRVENKIDLEIGNKIEVDTFDTGEFVNITGVSKGRGFQGVVRRYGFKGIRASHGSGYSRRPGSSGHRTFPGNVIKGKKFPGQMGNYRSTISNLKIEKIDKDENLIYVKGAIPGPNNGIVLISLSNKRIKNRED